jgi:hypothetical protein
MDAVGLRTASRRGTWVLAALVVLTLGEYVMALAMERGNLPYMIVMNVVDAALIVYYFMHVAQLRHPEE